MNEDLVKEVLLRHLELKGKQPRRRARQSSGPDVLVDGTAIEVKGSKIVERSALTQPAIYLHATPSSSSHYRGRILVFPLAQVARLGTAEPKRRAAANNQNVSCRA
jgi:hypothetical protein